MADPDPPFVLPDPSLYYGADEVAGDLRPSAKGHVLAGRQLSEEDSLQVGKLRISRRIAVFFSVETHPPPH